MTSSTIDIVKKKSIGGGCTVGVNTSPDVSLMLLMLLGLLMIMRRKIRGPQETRVD